MTRDQAMQNIVDRGSAHPEDRWVTDGFRFVCWHGGIKVTGPGNGVEYRFTWTEVIDAVRGQDSLFSNPEDEETIQARFEKFHAENPTVYTLLVELAMRAKDRGRKVGMKALWERLRWEVYVETDNEEGFKLPNDYTSRYARLIMQEEPALAEFFEIRALRAS